MGKWFLIDTIIKTIWICKITVVGIFEDDVVEMAAKICFGCGSERV